MQIGVVCEGPTDFLTIRSFLEVEFSKIQKTVNFVIIQPALDNTLPGGWSQVLYWLENNPKDLRSAIYLKSDSLFLSDDSTKKFDALLFQIDTDIIGEQGFEKFVTDRNIQVLRPIAPIERGEYVKRIIQMLAGHSDDHNEFAAKEISLAIVECCETWLIAAELPINEPEALQGQDLKDNFGKVMANFSGNPDQGKYTSMNKRVVTRQKLCENISKRSSPLGRAYQYDDVFKKINRIFDSI
jgi:hypothetical protein